MKHILFLSRLLLVVTSVLAGCAQMTSRPLEYSGMIAQAELTKEFDGRAELTRCVANWNNIKEKVRSPIPIASNEFFVILESGNAGWGGYYYVYVWKDQREGKLVTNMIGKDPRKNSSLNVSRADIESLMQRLNEIKKPISGYAGRFVSDGPCYFSKIGFPESVENFAVYGLSGKIEKMTPAETAVREILEFVKQYEK